MAAPRLTPPPARAPSPHRALVATGAHPGAQKPARPGSEATAAPGRCRPAGAGRRPPPADPPCASTFQAQATRQLAGAGQGKVWGFLDRVPREATACSRVGLASESRSPQHPRTAAQPRSRGSPRRSPALLRSRSRRAGPAPPLLPQLPPRTPAPGRRPSPGAWSSAEPGCSLHPNGER